VHAATNRLGSRRSATVVSGIGGMAVLAIAVGAALRLWQYGAGASQWLDELALSRSIVGLGWRDLLVGRLMFAQVAPRGFLAAERAGVAIWGASDYGLRLAPLICSLAALALFHRLAARALAAPAAVALACALFALQPQLIRYAAEVKPYAVDMALAVAMTLLATGLAAASPRRGLWIGLAGALAACCSNAAVMVLAGLAAALIVSRVAAARGASAPAGGSVATALAIALWAAGGVAATLLAKLQLTPEDQLSLERFWAPALAPIPHSWSGDAAWAARTLAGEVGAGGLGYPWPWACIALAALGAAALCRRGQALALLLFCPVAVAGAAAEARIYPFSNRLILWIVPALLLAMAAGAEAVAEGAAALCRRAGGRFARAGGFGVYLVYLAALAPAVAAFAADPPVYRMEESQPLLRAVAARRQRGDAIYVYYGAGHALSFYGPRFGFAPGDYMLGGNHRGDTRAYLHELDSFRGRPRLWVLISHAHPKMGEETAILDYLDSLGRRRLALRVLPHVRTGGLPVEAFLYDLSSPRLGNDAAATFPVAPPVMRLDPRLEREGAANPVPRVPLAEPAGSGHP
jgi:hypothetical protein